MSSAAVYVKSSKEHLEYNQSRKRGQLLIFESHLRNFVVFCRDLCFAGLHLRWPPS